MGVSLFYFSSLFPADAVLYSRSFTKYGSVLCLLAYTGVYVPDYVDTGTDIRFKYRSKERAGS